MAETVVVRLGLRDFRNFDSVEFRPSPEGLTVVQGDNGAGKSSLLEAIVYASSLQSFRGAPREAIVRQGAVEASVQCDVLAGSRKVEIVIEIVPGRRDRAWHNTQRVPGVRGLLEVLNTTLFTPDDLELVKGGPAGRRDFVDEVLSRSHPRLGADRAALDRVLRHRNALVASTRRSSRFGSGDDPRGLGRSPCPDRGTFGFFPSGRRRRAVALGGGRVRNTRGRGRRIRDAICAFMGGTFK